MRIISRVLVLALALVFGVAYAQTSTRTYPRLTWNFSSNASGFFSCDFMQLDATGGSDSVHYAVYGYVNCPGLGGSYLADGNAYFDANGRFNMQMDVGVQTKLLCVALIGFNGSCSLWNANGQTVGSAQISLR